MIASAPQPLPAPPSLVAASPAARDDRQELVDSALARPLFAASRRPAAVAAGPVAAPANLPRLAGILVHAAAAASSLRRPRAAGPWSRMRARRSAPIPCSRSKPGRSRCRVPVAHRCCGPASTPGQGILLLPWAPAFQRRPRRRPTSCKPCAACPASPAPPDEVHAIAAAGGPRRLRAAQRARAAFIAGARRSHHGSGGAGERSRGLAQCVAGSAGLGGPGPRRDASRCWAWCRRGRRKRGGSRRHLVRFR